MDRHAERAAYFDRWYADMAESPVKDEIQQRHLGLPPELLSTSLLTWDGLAEVVAELALDSGELLVDLACGRGGYGLEIASRTGARVVGVDFAPTALEPARTSAVARGIEADYRVGDLVATGLPGGGADAVLVVDAIQFPDAPSRAYAEIARILRPGGRAVLTCWEAVDPDDVTVPDRLRRVDLRRGLEEAGLVDVSVRERADWREAERAMWTEAAALDPRDDPALVSFHDEAVRSLAGFDRVRRVMASATQRDTSAEVTRYRAYSEAP